MHTISNLRVDHRVIAVDLPGFGGSEVLPAPLEMVDYANALIALLDHLVVSTVMVVGHSLGGVVAQRLAIAHASRLDALVLVSSGARRPAALQSIGLRGLAVVSSVLSRIAPLEPLGRSGIHLAMAVEPFRRQLVAQAIHDPTAFPADVAVEMMTGAAFSPGFAAALRAATGSGIWDDLHEIRCRTLILTGERDRLVSVDAVRELAARIPAATLEVWPDVGHHPMLERTSIFNERVRRFVGAPPRCAEANHRSLSDQRPKLGEKNISGSKVNHG
jgi:pimeloyl-ACP methyl ester carboxylesterase